MGATTFRADLVAGIGTMMTAYIAANPTLLRRHYRFRPPSTATDTPYSYVDLRPETVHFDSSIRDRTLTADIVVLDRWTEGGENMDRLDVLADSLLSFIGGPTYFHIVANSSWSDIAITDESTDDGRVGFRIRLDVTETTGDQI